MRGKSGTSSLNSWASFRLANILELESTYSRHRSALICVQRNGHVDLLETRIRVRFAALLEIVRCEQSAAERSVDEQIRMHTVRIAIDFHCQ